MIQVLIDYSIFSGVCKQYSSTIERVLANIDTLDVETAKNGCQ